MPLSRSERLRIIQEVHREWQQIYGDREDSEAEAANYEMIEKAISIAEKELNVFQKVSFGIQQTKLQTGKNDD